MKHILAQSERDVLARLSWSSALLGFDYDGTLVPIANEPSGAELGGRTRRLLTELASLYPCLIISGRSLADLQARTAGVGLRAVIGNHGLEPWLASAELGERVARWKALLEPALAGLQGVSIEDKTYSLSVHFRRARRREQARVAILAALAPLGELRVIGGKQVVNVLPAGAPHKGTALERERERLGCDTALYIGDDETDEDVFALEQAGRLVTVRVGPSRASRASHFLRNQGEVDSLLERLIDLRRERREAR